VHAENPSAYQPSHVGQGFGPAAELPLGAIPVNKFSYDTVIRLTTMIARPNSMTSI